MCCSELMKCKGYKLRTHISRALKARSKSIAAAVKSYNEAAIRVSQPTLVFDQVLKYVFVGEFDVIRMSRFRLSSRPWSHRAEREAAIDFFKLERSREEIQRLDIEIRRLHVHILDSEVRTQAIIDELEKKDANLAVQLKKRQRARRSKNVVHLSRLEEIEAWSDFSGFKDPLRDYTVTSEVSPPHVVHQDK